MKVDLFKEKVVKNNGYDYQKLLYEKFYTRLHDLRNFPIIYLSAERGKVFLSVRDDTTGEFINGKSLTCYYKPDGKIPKPLTNDWWQKFIEWGLSCQKLSLEKDKDNPVNFNWFEFNKQGIALAKLLKNELENECHIIYILPHLDLKTQEFKRLEIMGDGKLMPLKYHKMNDEWVYDNSNSCDLEKFN